MFFFSFCQITGCALVGTGAYLRAEKEESYTDLCDKLPSWATGANILIAAGVIILVVAFFGCFGAYKQSTCMLGIVSFSMFYLKFQCYPIWPGAENSCGQYCSNSWMYGAFLQVDSMLL